MNTQQRIFLLTKFSRHLQLKLRKIQKQKQTFIKNIQTNDVDFNSLPKIDVISQLSLYHKDIDKTINDTYQSVSSVMDNLTKLKNRKQNTQKLNDILSSISMIKQLSLSLKIDNIQSLSQLYKSLATFYQVKQKAKYCDKFIKEIQEEIVKIQEKYKKEFDEELTKKNSSNIKELAKILEIIKVNKKGKGKQEMERKNSMIYQKQGENGDKKTNTKDAQQQQINQVNNKKQSSSQSQSLSQIAQFYVTMVKKQLQKYQDDLFNIPIISPNPNELSYIFFDIIKNCLKSISTIISTYHTNIIQLQTIQGLHIVITTIFRYSMSTIIYEILVRQKRYYEIDKIVITQNKLSIKSSQYKILKNYFKEFNAIWNQIQRFKMHLYEYVQRVEGYAQEKKMKFNKQLTDIINGQKFVNFNYQIILYFQAFFRHQLDRLLKKSPFVVSLWQMEQEFFKDVRQKNQFKSNLAGQDFIQEMILKFSQGIKKSFQTLNILIVSALINFVNHNLIYQDSFYAFNELFDKFVKKISSQNKAIQGIVILLNTASTYPKAIKSSFQQLQIPQQLPKQRIQNQISQLIHNCKQKTAQFITQAFDKILNQDFIVQKLSRISSSNPNSYQQIVTKHFPHFQKDLLELFVYKLSKVHLQILLQQQFKQKYSHMEVLALEKQVRNIINFYQSKSHSIRENFRKILDFIEVLLIQSEGSLKKLVEQWKGKYEQEEIRRIWKLRTQ